MSMTGAQNQPARRGALLVLLAAVFWGTTGTSQALAPEGATSLSIGALRLALGGTVLLGFALLRQAFRQGGRWPVWPTLLAAASMAAYQLFFFAGVARTGVAVGTVVAIGSSPVLAGLIGLVLRGERPSRAWGLATFLAVAGCALLILAGSAIQVNLPGIILALGAGTSYALFAVVSKTLLEKHPPEAVMAVAFFLGAVLLLPFLYGADLAWLARPAGWGVILHLGAVTVALAYSLFAYGLQHIPVATAATLTLAEPMTAGLLGVFLLGERLTPPALLGIGLIFAGLVLVSLRRG